MSILGMQLMNAGPFGQSAQLVTVIQKLKLLLLYSPLQGVKGDIRKTPQSSG
jgi:hypothetical protein